MLHNLDSVPFTKDEIAKAILQAKEQGKYIGFDLSFLLNYAHKIEYEILQNVKVVIPASIIRNLLEQKEKRDFKAVYALNFIDEISKRGKLTVIPETQYPHKFKEYLYEWKLSYKNPFHQVLGYYLKLHEELDFDILLLTEEDTEDKKSLPLHFL